MRRGDAPVRAQKYKRQPQIDADEHSISANWRLIFRFEQGNVYKVDLLIPFNHEPEEVVMATADMAEQLKQLEQDNIRHGEVETQLKEEQVKQRAEQTQQGKEQGRLSGIVDQHDARLASQEATIREGFSNLYALNRDLNARLDKLFAVIIAGFLVIFGTIITVALSMINGQ